MTGEVFFFAVHRSTSNFSHSVSVCVLFTFSLLSCEFWSCPTSNVCAFTQRSCESECVCFSVLVCVRPWRQSWERCCCCCCCCSGGFVEINLPHLSPVIYKSQPNQGERCKRHLARGESTTESVPVCEGEREV